jgi:uncharacterized protein (TIGR00730 family)
MKYIAIFCGSASGNDPVYAQQASLLGEVLVRRGYGIIYGAGKVGLMGTIADSILAAGGEVIGVIPEFLKVKELLHTGVTKIHTVKTMEERKALMNEMCDAVITLPGGFGTMDEYFEVLTLGQLSRHKKPVALLNTNGYYDSLLSFTENMIEAGFLKDEYRKLLLVESDIEKLIDKIEEYEAPANEKWFEPQLRNIV